MVDDRDTTTHPDSHLDIDAEHERLEALHHRIEEVREQAGEDLEMGGKGRILPDARMHREVIESGDAPLHRHADAPTEPPAE